MEGKAMTMTLIEAQRILDVPWGADLQEIKIKYRRLAMKHHPDRGGREEAMKPINEAYQILQRSAGERDLSATLFAPWQAAVRAALQQGKKAAKLMGEPWFSCAEVFAPVVAAFWGIKV